MSVKFSDKDFDRIKRGISEVILEDELYHLLEKSAREKKPLRLKAGFDPTAADIHLGHSVLIRKLRQFQELGHKVFFLIGDFTARIGDPSGRDQGRVALSKEEVKKNTATYEKQVFKILDSKKTEVVFNSSWFEKMDINEFLKLTSFATVAQLLARADFKQRFEQQKEISILEFLYPILQGYDSVYLKADIEFGGTDQKFNLLMGRQLQEVFKQKPQTIIMMPLLEGTDGIQKMSKSLGNYIGVTERPRQMFGKVMSISDELMFRYFELLTDLDINEMKALHPKEAKLKLAEDIVKQYYGSKKAQESRNEFENIFSKGDIPNEMPLYKIDQTGKHNLIKILVDSQMVKTGNEARRLVKQGAIALDGQKIVTEVTELREGVLRIGKHKFLKLIRN